MSESCRILRVMKYYNLILMVLMLSSISQAQEAAPSQPAASCYVECDDEGRPGFGAVLGQIAGDFVYTNTRGYGTWVRTCRVLTPGGILHLRDTISGAEVQQLAYEMAGLKHGPGDTLDARRAKRTRKQDARMQRALAECQKRL